MLATLFLGFVAATAAGVVALAARYLGKRAAGATLVGLAGWLTYVGLMSSLGVVRDPALRPPGIVWLAVPAFAFVGLFACGSAAGGRVALAVPLGVLLAAQAFRVGVELFLHQLWVDGLVPRMLTFSGANVDVYVGASAPLVAWWSARGGRSGLMVALAWNGLGLLALANVVARAVLTAPGPLNLVHAEVPNGMIGTFSYTFVPGFFVPLAVTLHALAIRAAGRRLRGGSTDAASPPAR